MVNESEDLMMKELRELKEFKKTVLPRLEKYIQLMHLVGNHTEVAFLEIYLSKFK